MTDKELLELAAKAAGIDVVRSRIDDPMNQDFLVRKSHRNEHQASGPWNPITDDGDAARLIVAVNGLFKDRFRELLAIESDQCQSDYQKAFRIATTKYASEIGEGK